MTHYELRDGRWCDPAEDYRTWDRCDRCKYKGASCVYRDGELLCSICFPNGDWPDTPAQDRPAVWQKRIDVTGFVRRRRAVPAVRHRRTTTRRTPFGSRWWEREPVPVWMISDILDDLVVPADETGLGWPRLTGWPLVDEDSEDTPPLPAGWRRITCHGCGSVFPVTDAELVARADDLDPEVMLFCRRDCSDEWLESA